MASGIDLTMSTRTARVERRHAPDIAVEDWDLLCAAVQERLGTLVAVQHSDPTEGFAGATLDRIRAGVLDCADALGQLRATLVHQRARAHDSLTDFRERLEQAVARTEPERQSLAVMYIDLDGFKLIDDTHGPAIGDEFACLLFAAAPDPRLTVRPSVGIAVWPTDGATADDLLRHARAAMYRGQRA